MSEESENPNDETISYNSVSNMPDRPLKLSEVRVIEEDNDEVKNAEALFYGSQINSAVCLFINISGSAYIIGFDSNTDQWVVLTEFSEDGSPTDYDNETDDILGWIKDIYGEDGFGIYQMF